MINLRLRFFFLLFNFLYSSSKRGDHFVLYFKYASPVVNKLSVRIKRRIVSNKLGAYGWRIDNVKEFEFEYEFELRLNSLRVQFEF